MAALGAGYSQGALLAEDSLPWPPWGRSTRACDPRRYGVGMPTSDLTRAVLASAVSAVGGSERTGQVQMATAVAEAIDAGEHLLVQAGTGTGKSLAYLSAVMARLLDDENSRVVIATATLALQAQLATQDVPAALAAARAVKGREPRVAVLKGRTNYACLYRVRGEAALQDTLLGVDDLPSRPAGPEASSALGDEVLALRAWAGAELSAKKVADRDDAPPHTERAWQQVSIPVRECLGTQVCPYGAECFVELSRQRARDADLVITNHALLAIDARHGGTALPEHDVTIVDEAHEVVARVTAAATDDITPAMVERAAKGAVSWVTDETSTELLDAADALRSALAVADTVQITRADDPLILALRRVATAARATASGMSGGDPDPERTQALAVVREVMDITTRMAALEDSDVVWVGERDAGRQVVVAPLSVSGLLRTGVLAKGTTIFTSATLQLGGRFEAIASQVGLRGADRIDGPGPEVGAGDAATVASGDEPMGWRALDVGSPFDYPRQAILYVARHLPSPGRDGISPETLADVAELVWAGQGRTLGLFSSLRAAVVAAQHVRENVPGVEVLCQGDSQLSDLTRRFVAEPATSLFGTLSLWQGIDVPGDTCRLVIIDRIPFPRPDEPLMKARQDAVTRAGGNGFMQVAATHAALLLAQGSGRLIRRLSDRGMVAVLDPRLMTARYAGFLRSSMPPMWTTTDREVAIASLRRLAAAD